MVPTKNHPYQCSKNLYQSSSREAENLRTFPTKKSREEKLYSQTNTAKTVLTVFRNKLLKPKLINLSILKQLYPEKKYLIT